jgi:alkaline phosphatase D
MSPRFSTRLNVDDFATVNRRALLRGLGASALVTSAGSSFARHAWATPAFALYPFTLGVASGDPAPDGFVLWTKLAPQPLARGGGMPMRPVEVEWSVATDGAMRQVVQKGTAVARPELGHAVHVEVGGLEAARDYFYQFTVAPNAAAWDARARCRPLAPRSRNCASAWRAARNTKMGSTPPIAASPRSASISSITTAITSTNAAWCVPASGRCRSCG